MLRNFALVTFIALNFIGNLGFAGSAAIQAKIRSFVSGSIGQDQVPQLFSELGQLSESEVSTILLTEFPIS
ncbi:MAG: hypothetical protein KDD35_08610, partial [Bdellovibrionales bacterium]|nr:hypothetical protein [Bdellovibrionales bacterium]